MVIFDGHKRAAQKEALLTQAVAQLSRAPEIGAVLFAEDPGSRLYTRLKQEAAYRVGIKYQLHEFSVKDPVEKVLDTVTALNTSTAITGIIIQKPTKRIWESTLETEQGREENLSYNDWWNGLIAGIDVNKDVDGLHPSTLVAIAENTWQEQGRVLPATCQAVVEIMKDFCTVDAAEKPENGSLENQLHCLKGKKITLLGKSDLMGRPLFYLLHNFGLDVEMIGSKELAEREATGEGLQASDVVVTATGRHHLIRGHHIKQGAVVIDVGEPRPDVDFASVKEKAGYLTPVPGGVGPMTVVCLLENAVRLVQSNNSSDV